MFGDPISNSKSENTELGKNIFKFSSGKFNPTKNLNDKNLYPCYGGNGITGYASDFIIKNRTIVIGRVGAYCGSVHVSEPNSWVTDNAIYLKQYNSEKFDLLFLYYLFSFLNLNRFSSASGQPKITQLPLDNLLYIVPNMALQKDYALFLRELDKSKFRMKKCLKLLSYIRHL